MAAMRLITTGFLSLPLACRQGGYTQYQGWVGFPIAFPHACFYASSAAYSGDWDYYDNMRNLTGFTIYGDGSNKLWIAFGY